MWQASGYDAKTKFQEKAPGRPQAHAVYTTYVRVYTILHYNSLELRLLGDGAVECTTIKIQRGTFYHSSHLGFSTIKPGLWLKLIPDKKKIGRRVYIQRSKTCTVDFSGKNSQFFFFKQNNSLSISYHSFIHSPSEYLNPNLSLDKPTLFQEVNRQLLGPKASA